MGIERAIGGTDADERRLILADVAAIAEWGQRLAGGAAGRPTKPARKVAVEDDGACPVERARRLVAELVAVYRMVPPPERARIRNGLFRAFLGVEGTDAEGDTIAHIAAGAS